MQPPSFGARIVARFIDGLAISAVASAVSGFADASSGRRVVAAVLVAVLYETVSVGTTGRTVGKAVFKLRVVDVDGGNASWAQAAMRAVVLMVPLNALAPRIDTVIEWAVLVFVLANLVVISMRREDRRGIHDLVAGTRPIGSAADGQ